MYVNVENVNFAYDKKPILHDINFGMNKGEITGLIGPNGAGKSTMLKLMIKKMKPDNGKIIIGDNDIFSIKRENNPVTFIPDIPVYYEELTLKDIIFSIILSACINGIHLNRNFLFILLIIFLLLNTTNLMRYYSEK